MKIKELVFASGNAHKIEEIEAILGGEMKLIGLPEVGIDGDLEESAATLEGNAQQKARFVFSQTGRNCFADDTGLEVQALNGAPGVHSARYAGEMRDNALNRKKLLQELTGKSDRSARFRTVFCLLFEGKEYLFEGIVTGAILSEERGSGGFGYDALFCPEGESRSFAEMSSLEKNQLSHRGRAAIRLAEFLRAM